MASSTREVVTLQIGHYSNFIGTHWWNIQESAFVYNPDDLREPKEINHDVMFREGKNLEGEVTYTPRLVAVDLKGSLHTLKQDGVLYDVTEQQDDFKWTGDVTLHQHQSHQAEKNEFLKDLEKQDAGNSYDKDKEQKSSSQDEMDVEEKSDKEAAPHVFGKKLYNLDESVHVWSDFLRLHLHPKTMAVINEYQHGSEQSFDVFGNGQQVISNQKNKDDLEDRLHFFLEECDHLQGIHVLVDAYNGFGGVASNITQDLCDEYSGKSIVVMPVSPPSFPNSKSQADLHRLISTTLSYVNLLNHSSVVLPLSTASSLWRQPGKAGFWANLNYKNDLMFHTSAILGASLDTMSLPYRLESNASLMSHMYDALTPSGRKVVALQSSFPFPLVENNGLVHALHLLGDKLPWQQLTPLCPAQTHPYSQSVVLRGITADKIASAPSRNRPRMVTQYSSLDEVLLMFLNDVCSNSLNASNVLHSPCKVTAPFPHIFSPKINSSGEVSKKERHEQQGVERVPVMTSLQSTPSVGDLITNLHQHAAKLDISKFHKFTEAGLEVDEFKESLDSLESLAHNYEPPADMETG